MSWISQFAGNLGEATKDPIDLDIAKKHILKVIVADGKFEGYVDGQLIREWSDNRFKQGAVSMAFCCDASKVVFDDFVISGNDVPNSELAVSHQEKLTVCWAKIKGN